MNGRSIYTILQKRESMSEYLIRPDNPPTIEQVTSFARACILFAHRHGELRKLKGSYRIGPMARYTPPDIVEGEPFGFLFEDTVIVHAKMDNDHDTVSSMKTIHTVAAREISDSVGGSVASASELRTVNKFKVSDGGIVESSRQLEQTVHGIKLSQGSVSLDDINLDNLYVPDNIAEIITLENEFRVMTEDDFTDIMRDVTERMNAVDRKERAFSEVRQNYLSYFDR